MRAGQLALSVGSTGPRSSLEDLKRGSRCRASGSFFARAPGSVYLVTAILLSVLQVHCSPPALRVAFTVDFSRNADGLVGVVMRVTGQGSGPLVLSSFAQPGAMRVESPRARSGGKELAVTQSLDARGFPAWSLIRPPGTDEVILEYAVRPGAVETARMSGPTGFRLGYLDESYGLFTARQVFFLPTMPRLPDRIDVRLVGPPRQDVVATWSGPGPGLEFSFEGRDLSRKFLDAVIAIGRFEAHRSASHDFEVLIQSRIPEDIRREAARRAIALEEYLYDRLGGHARRYRLVLVPKTPDGLSIPALSAPGGLGLTLGPGLPTRWLTIGRAIGQAYLADRLGALPKMDPGRRILEALPTYLTVQVSERDGWRSKRDWYEQFYTETVDLDLREPDDAIETTRLEWRTTVALENLSRALEHEGRGSLDQIVADILGREHPPDWGRFVEKKLSPELRASLGRWLSAEPFPFPLPGQDETDAPRQLPAPPPAVAAGGAIRRFDFYFGARNLGLLEQCGCKKEQLGGMARRATVLRRRLASGIPALALELGDAVSWDHDSPGLDSQKLAESDLALALMAQSGVRATVVGHAEISYGRDFLAERVARLPAGFAMLSANVSGPRLSLPPILDIARARPRITIVGAMAPSSYDLGRALEFEDAAAELSIADPATAVARALSARPESGLTVVAGPLGPRQVMEIHTAVPDLRLIVTSNYFRFLRLPLFRFERPVDQATFGMLDRTLVVLLKSDAKALVRLGLSVNDDGRIAGADLETIPLNDAIPDDLRVRRRLDRHYAALAAASEMPDRPPMGDLLGRMVQADYVGSEKCASCHPAEGAHWLGTAHSTAFTTLLQKHRQGVPGCYACHVTGYRQPTGYRSMSDVRLRHVQCESCHGPGSRHLASPGADSIVRVPPASVCRECHTPEHSDMTDANFDDYWAQITHTSGGQAATDPERPSH